MRIAAQGPVEELHHTAEALELLQQEDLVDILAGETIRRRDEDALDMRGGDGVAQGVEAGAAQGDTAVAVVTEQQALLEM